MEKKIWKQKIHSKKENLEHNLKMYNGKELPKFKNVFQKSKSRNIKKRKFKTQKQSENIL